MLSILFFLLFSFDLFANSEDLPPEWLWDDDRAKDILVSSEKQKQEISGANDSANPFSDSVSESTIQTPFVVLQNWKEFYSSWSEMKAHLREIFAKKQYAEFLSRVDFLLAQDSDNREFLYKKAFAQKFSDKEDAVKTYNLLLRYHPDYKQAWYEKGVIESALKNYSEALLSMNKAVELGLRQTWLYYDRGIVLIRLRDQKEALSSFLEAVKISQKNHFAFLEIANIYFAQKQYVHALQFYQKVQEIAPQTKGLSEKISVCVKKMEK